MHAFKKILLVNNPKDGDADTFPTAIQLTRRCGASLHVMEVVPELPGYLKILNKPLSYDNLQKLMVQDRHEKLQKIVGDTEGLNITHEVVVGKAVVEIIQQVLKNGYDLVIYDSGDEDGLAVQFFGSTAMQLMRKCPCPVWVMTPQAKEGFSKILVAVDPDEGEHDISLNNTMMKISGELAGLNDAELHVVHAWSLPGEHLLAGSGGLRQQKVDEMVEEIRLARKKAVNQLVGRHDIGNVNVIHHLEKGDPALIIPQLIKDHQIELVVMGTVSRNKMEGLFMGNTAEKILNRVNCSVLTVKPHDFVSPIKLRS